MSAARGTETPGVDLGALSEAAAAVLRLMQSDDLCHSCWREVATEAQWDLVPEGGRPDLCWEGPFCTQVNEERFASLAAEAALAHRDGELIPASAVEALADVVTLTRAELSDLAAAYGWWKAHGDPEVFEDVLTDAFATRLRALVESARAGDAQ